MSMKEHQPGTYCGMKIRDIEIWKKPGCRDPVTASGATFYPPDDNKAAAHSNPSQELAVRRRRLMREIEADRARRRYLREKERDRGLDPSAQTQGDGYA